jgi:hypothetical protein
MIVRDGRPSSPAGDLNETKLTQLRIFSLSLTPAQVAAATSAYQNLTVTGVAVGDFVVCIGDPIANATAVTGAKVASANTVAVSFTNPTAGPLTPTSGTYVFLVGRYSNT